MSSPNNESDLLTQCLFGEFLEIIQCQYEWVFIHCLEDNYNGWIKKVDIGLFTDFTHYISSVRSIIVSEQDVKSKFISYLPFRSKVRIYSSNDNWAKIFYDDKQKKYGFIPLFHIMEKKKIKKDWIKFAENLLNTPYRWGGRDSLGIDCSALVQLSIAFSGLRLPRDSGEQIIFFKNKTNFLTKKISKTQNFKRGDLIYWKGHISIVVNQKQLIHASAYHNKVVIEDIKKAIERINLSPLLISKK